MFSPNPWKDRTVKDVVAAKPCEIHTLYPTSQRDERRCLQEIRSIVGEVNDHTILKSGIPAVDFCFHFIMKHHFKRKKPKA